MDARVTTGGAGLANAYPTWLVSLALGAALFSLDSFTLIDGAASALYGGVLVILAERRQWRIVAAAAGACLLLTALSYLVAHGNPVGSDAVDDDAIFRRAVSVAAIAAATLLTLLNLFEQKKIDAQLQLLKLNKSALFVRDLDGLITFWSAGAEGLYGWSESEAVGRDAGQLLNTEFPHGARTETTLATRGRTTRDGRNLLVSVSWAVQRDWRGHAVGVLETGVDVTQRQQSNEALFQSESRYRAIFNTVGISIFEEDLSGIIPLLDELRVAGVADLRRYVRDNPCFVRRCVEHVRVVDVNDGAMRIYRAKTKQELLQSLSQIYPPGSTGSFAEILVAMAEGKPSCMAQTFVRAMDGTPLTVQMSITFPTRDDSMASVIVCAVDFTTRYQAEENLARARDSLTRLGQVSSLGEAVASIAHEMNQPLAAIVANAEAALRWLRRGEPDRAEAADALERIAHEGERAVQVLERICSFLNNTAPRRVLFDLSAAVEETALLLSRTLQRQHVTLQIQMEAGLPPILGDRIQIEQVITNLLINAMEAMREDLGRPRTVIIRAVQQNHGIVRTEVQDNGPGVPAHGADQLFRPFFTTKAQGTGLGLSISRSIIQGHGGSIWISGQGETGATVCFTLPGVPDDPPDQIV